MRLCHATRTGFFTTKDCPRWSGSSTAQMAFRALRMLVSGEGDPMESGLRAALNRSACSATTERDASYLIRNNYEYT